MSVKKMDQKTFVHMNLLFNVFYNIGKNNKPFFDFEGLLELNIKLGLEIKNMHNNDKRCKKFISFMMV